MQILFILGFALVLFGSHFFIYYSAIIFLGIVGIYRIWFGTVIFLLPTLFIISAILAHYVFNYITRIFYFASGLWLATALNFILVFMGIWLLVGISKIFNFQVDFKILSWIGIAISLLFVLYGIWNTYDLKVKNITVKIKDLPVAWVGRRAVQISDVHLGYVYGKDYMQSIVDKTNELNPDIVFITGDLFDGMDGHLDEMVAPINNLKAPLGIYFVTGNHETYLGIDTVFNVLRKTKINILDDDLRVIDDLQIVGASFSKGSIMETRDFSEFFKSLTGFSSAKPIILLYHSPTNIEQARDLGVDLFLAGHTHVGQLFPLSLITKAVYKGYDYGFYHFGDFSIYISSGVGTWGPTVRTSKNSEITFINFEVK